MDLTTIINRSIDNLPPDEHRKYIGASQIGHECPRYIWYKLHNCSGRPLTAQTKMNFLIGRVLEKSILDLLEIEEIPLERPTQNNNWLFCQDSEVPLLQGHLDAIINNEYVLEIKTAKESSFNQFVKRGLKNWSNVYYAQVIAYMGMMDFEIALMLVLNKNTGQFHHEEIKFDPYMYSELRMKALAISATDDPPARINKNPTYLLCSRCEFKNLCHGGE